MTREELQQKIEQDKIERKARLKEHWNNLKPFVNSDDVPALPGNVDKEEWKEFYVPRLIKLWSHN